MAWFALNDEASPDLVIQGDRIYAVLDVIKNMSSSLNEEDDLIAGRQTIYSRGSLVGDRLIRQFFEEEFEADDFGWEEFLEGSVEEDLKAEIEEQNTGIQL